MSGVLYLSRYCRNCRDLMDEIKRTGNTSFPHVVFVDTVEARRALPRVVTAVPTAVLPGGAVLAGSALFDEVARAEAQADCEPDGVGADGYGALLDDDPAQDANAHLDQYFATSGDQKVGMHADAREDRTINLDALAAARMADVQMPARAC